MSEHIDIYIETTTKVPEGATEFDYELFERFMSGGPWVAHSEYMKLKDDNAKLRELVRDLWEACPADGYYCIYHCEHYDKESESHCKLEDRMAELGIEVDE